MLDIAVGDGKLQIFAGDPWDTKSRIAYKGKTIQEFSDVFISLYSFQFLDFGDDAVLIYYINPGGSGTPNAYALISINRQGRIYEADLPVGTGRFETVVARDKISFDLGLTDGKEVRAVYANGRLDVTRTTAPKTGLKPQDCDFLYNDVLTECADTRQTACRYNDMSISMVSQRPMNMMAVDDQNFRQKDFETACEQSCKVKRKPAYAAFRKVVCLPK